MNKESFIEFFCKTMNGTIKDITELLAEPKGKDEYIKYSKWYNSLSEESKAYVKESIADAASSVIWKWFCILDEVSFLEGAGEKGRFDLYFTKNGEKTLINNPNEEEIHSIYSADYVHSKNKKD